MRVDEHTIEVARSPIFYRRGVGGDTPILYLHGVPTSSDDWSEALARTGGIAPDLPGFGRSGKAGNLDYSLDGYADFLERLLSAVGVQRVSLVAHDWGAAAGLNFAHRHPERVHRIVLFNPLPWGDAFGWHGLARAWRIPGVGELVMGSINRPLLARALRRASASPDTWPAARVAAVWEQFDQGTQRAILRLHRSTDEARIATAATQLRELAMPTLILWSERTRSGDERLAEAFTAGFPHAALEHLAGTGHWPWLDRPELIDRVAGFLAAGPN